RVWDLLVVALLGCSLLRGLLSCGLLGRLLGSRLLSGGLLGRLLRRGLLGGGLLGRLLCGRLLGGLLRLLVLLGLLGLLGLLLGAEELLRVDLVALGVLHGALGDVDRQSLAAADVSEQAADLAGLLQLHDELVRVHAVLGSGEANVIHQLLLGDLRLLDVSQGVQEQLGADGALSGLPGIFLELFTS